MIVDSLCQNWSQKGLVKFKCQRSRINLLELVTETNQYIMTYEGNNTICDVFPNPDDPTIFPFDFIQAHIAQSPSRSLNLPDARTSSKSKDPPGPAHNQHCVGLRRGKAPSLKAVCSITA